MSLAFDTGLPRSLRETIANAIATKLVELKRPAMYLTRIVTLPRMISGSGDEDGLIDLAKAGP